MSGKIGKNELDLILKSGPLKAVYKDLMADELEKEGITIHFMVTQIKQMLSNTSQQNAKVRYNLMRMLFKFAGWLDDKVDVNLTGATDKSLDEQIDKLVKNEVLKIGMGIKDYKIDDDE